MSTRIRAQPNADATLLERAMDIADSHDVGSGIMAPSKLSFCNLPDSILVARASKLGVSLAKSPVEIASSVRELKTVENDRCITRLKNNIGKEDDDPHCLYVSHLSGLCEDLTEEDNGNMVDHSNLQCHVPKNTRGRKKKSFDKSKVRRSARLRKSTQKSN